MCGTRSRGPSRRRAASAVANAVSLLAWLSVRGRSPPRRSSTPSALSARTGRSDTSSSQAQVIVTAGLAHVEMAREAWETALLLFEESQLPDADEIRGLLGRSRIRAAPAADAMTPVTPVTGCRAGGARRRATIRR